MARPLSGSINSVKPVDGTPSGGPLSARELISSADLRRVSGSAPSHCTTRAYMSRSSSVACERPTLTGADPSGQALEVGIRRDDQRRAPCLLRDHLEARRDAGGDLGLGLRRRVVVPDVQLA